MSKGRRLAFLLSLLCLHAAAQLPDDEYYPYAEREERREMLATDSTIFYRAVLEPSDRYGLCSDFRLPQVALKRRGCASERALFCGFDLPYRCHAVLRLLGAEEERLGCAVAAPEAAGFGGSTRSFAFSEAEPLRPYLASVRFADRNYRVGARAAASMRFGRDWGLSVALDARTGRDLYVDGVFTHALSLGVHLVRDFASWGTLSVACLAPLSMQGTRLSSCEEAFALTGDRFYNPAWGFQDGRIRNSRVRCEAVPLTVVAYTVPLSRSTVLAVAGRIETGPLKYSRLDWYDARTPMPDHYRYLPSYTGDRETERVWRTADPHYTQIDWDALIRRNRMAGGPAVYALEDRVERLGNLSFRAVGTTELDDRLLLRYGVQLDRRHSRFFKRMRDLLGAEYVTDIDRFLVDDDTYGTLLQNDLRHPDRKIRRGDRFGYDYALTVHRADLFFQAEWRSDRLRLDCSAALGSAGVRRRGYYEKELFPGAQSFGRSRTMRFTPYALALRAGWAFSPRHAVDLALRTEARPPEPEDLFYQPLYNNRTIDGPGCARSCSAELGYRTTGPVADFRAAAFGVLTLDEVQTRPYYDDLAAVYCDMAVTGIGRLAYGVEVAADFRLAARWLLSLAASAGRSKYVRNPLVTVLSDVDHTVVDLRSPSRMGGCETGGTPQLTAAVELAYFGPRGWGCRVSAGYAGRRFVEPMPLRRTDRIAGQAGITPEAFEAFTRQERLDDALTLDASLFKSFSFGHSRLVASLQLRNLLNDDAFYNGYESLRVRRVSSGDAVLYMPHATRYTAMAPRSFGLTVSWCF